MYIRFISHSLFIALLTACAIPVVEKETRFSTGVEILEYNNVMSKYVARPTFGSIVVISGIEQYRLRAARYGVGEQGVNINRAQIDYYISAINKYQEWHRVASRNEHIINKEIARFSDTYGDVSLSFYSANEYSHYLSVSRCFGVSDCTVIATFDFDSSKLLHEELVKFDRKELLNADIEKLYR